MKATAFILMILSVVSKVFGFVREIVLSYYYGTGMVADAFVIAITVPFVLFNFVTIGVSTSYIPIYNEVYRESGEERANLFTSNLSNIVFFTSILFTVVGIVFAEPLVKLFAMGFEGEKLSITVRFVQLLFLSLFATGFAAVFRGYLQIKNNYIIPATCGLILNIVIILSLVLSSFSGSLILMVGTCLAMILQYAYFIPFITKTGYKHKKIIDFSDPHIKQVLIASIPIIFGMAVSDINVIVDKTLASSIGTGGVSTMNYAARVNNFVTGIVILSIGTVIFPLMSKYSAEDDMKGYKKTIVEAINLSSILIIPATIGFMLYAKPIISLLFERGQFNEQDVIAVSGGLFFYSLGLMGTSFIDIFSKAFYSLKDMKTPVKVSAIIVLINVTLSILFSKFIGLNGLALGTAIASLTGGFLLLILLRNKVGSLGYMGIFKNIAKILLCSAIMGALSYAAFALLLPRLGSDFSLLIAIGVAVVVYLVLVVVMRVEGVMEFVGEVRKRIK